jgi:hypothetical protein
MAYPGGAAADELIRSDGGKMPPEAPIDPSWHSRVHMFGRAGTKEDFV